MNFDATGTENHPVTGVRTICFSHFSLRYLVYTVHIVRHTVVLRATCTIAPRAISNSIQGRIFNELARYIVGNRHHTASHIPRFSHSPPVAIADVRGYLANLHRTPRFLALDGVSNSLHRFCASGR